MADPPADPVGIDTFIAAIGVIGLAIVAALGFMKSLITGTENKLDKTKTDLETDLSLTKRELWAHNDEHVKGHVRADDIGLLRNWMQAEELRMCDLLEKMEGRLMAEIRTLQAQTHILSTEMAAMKVRTERPALYGRGGDGS